MILNGWKEIANYLGRGVRTVQRWERLGLPVRRPNARIRSAVVTTSQDLDRWLSQCGNGRADQVEVPASKDEQPSKSRGDATVIYEQVDEVSTRTKNRNAARAS